MNKSYSITRAKNEMSHLVHEVEQEGPVHLTRRGRPVAVVLSIDEYERLQRSRPSPFEAIHRLRSRIASEDNLDIDPGEVFDGGRDRSPGTDIIWRGRDFFSTAALQHTEELGRLDDGNPPERVQHQEILISGDEDVRVAFYGNVEKLVIFGITADFEPVAGLYRLTAPDQELGERLRIAAVDGETPPQSRPGENFDDFFQDRLRIEEPVSPFDEQIENRSDGPLGLEDRANHH